MIEEYKFGSITISGKTYTEDIDKTEEAVKTFNLIYKIIGLFHLTC